MLWDILVQKFTGDYYNKINLHLKVDASFTLVKLKTF
jgi:hypothetical protein